MLRLVNSSLLAKRFHQSPPSVSYAEQFMFLALSKHRLRTKSARLPRVCQETTRARPLRSCQTIHQAQDSESTTIADSDVPYRKFLKDEAKRRRIAGESKDDAARKSKVARAQKWELTVGIEIHAQLNTERKLFSRENLRSKL